MVVVGGPRDSVFSRSQVSLPRHWLGSVFLSLFCKLIGEPLMGWPFCESWENSSQRPDGPVPHLVTGSVRSSPFSCHLVSTCRLWGRGWCCSQTMLLEDSPGRGDLQGSQLSFPMGWGYEYRCMPSAQPLSAQPAVGLPLPWPRPG